VVGGKPTDDVFAYIDEKPHKDYSEAAVSCGDRNDSAADANASRLELGGPWYFYKYFYPTHGYCQLPVAKVPEIGIEPGATLVVPLVVRHDAAKPLTITLSVTAPQGWNVADGAGQIALPPEASTAQLIHVDTPKLSTEELKKALPQEVMIRAEAEGKPAGEVKLRVLLRGSALPQ
jgi:hypothetical protein